MNKRLMLVSMMIGSLFVTLLHAEDTDDTVIKLPTQKKESPIKRLAELRLDEHIVAARMLNIPLPGRTKTVHDVLETLDRYAKEDSIGVVLFDISNLQLSLPDVQELQSGLRKIQESGKKVCAYLNGYSSMGYMIAAEADEIAVAPLGGVVVKGIGTIVPFMKGHYQMRGMEFDVITAGRYKYPGYLDRREPSPQFLEEFGTLLDSLIYDYCAIIKSGRDLTPERIREVVDTALLEAETAQQLGLIDKIAYYDDYRDNLMRSEKLRKYRDDSFDFSKVNSIQDLMETINRELRKAEEARQAVGPKIAVLHARGPIIDQNLGAGFSSMVISRDDFVEAVEELRKNSSVKAVVLRVDSPGGSAYASDIIWRALRQLDETKPLVVSMGTVAGSGGYYIACPARRIFAQPTTLTGSIGVLSVFTSAWSLYNRADYELYEMKRGARSTLGSSHRTLTPSDRTFIQEHILGTYDTFVDRVASTRKLPEERVREIAEGRIYTGRQAIELGLVDELGGLTDAIESARSMANIPESAELKILHYPRPSSLGELFESFSSVSMEEKLQTLMQMNGPAKHIGFEQQLLLFSQEPKAYCWMAMPELSWGNSATPNMMTDLLRRGFIQQPALPSLPGWTPSQN